MAEGPSIVCNSPAVDGVDAFLRFSNPFCLSLPDALFIETLPKEYQLK